MVQYLRHDSQMGRQFHAVWAWRDWPGRDGRPDTGIDIVAQPVDGEGLVAVQCKFYAAGHAIQKSDIDSFLSESGKEGFSGRIIVETTGHPWSPNAEHAIVGQQIPVRRIGLTDLRNSDLDWSTFHADRPKEAPGRLERKELRPHQEAAIRDVFAGFASSRRGQLIMACGTGKTFTSLKIVERLAAEQDGSARILFMVPSLALMSQTLREWASECALPFHAWSVCSDTKVNRRRASANSDLADIAATDLKTPPTTDPQRLAASLRRARDVEGLQVVFATYQSIDVVSRAQALIDEAWADFDLVICDEAHRTTGATLAGDDDSAFMRVHDERVIRAERRLYMTATPKLFRDEVKNAAKEKDAVLASMDDEALFGPVFHRLGFGEAVGAGLLTDYKVVVLGVPEDQVSAAYQHHAADADGELRLPDVAKLVGCWNAFAKRNGGAFEVSYGEDAQPMRRAVIFAKDIRTSKWVSREFPELVRTSLRDLVNDDDSDDLGVECRHVDGTMNAIERGDHLDWLKREDGAEAAPVTRVLTNARCLSEGVDVPSLDAVVFLNPRKSQVDVIQAVGRVMRRSPGKRFGYVILPVAIPAGMDPAQALGDNERYRVIWQVLQALRAHDDRMDTTINAIAYNTRTPESIIVDVLDFGAKARAEGVAEGRVGGAAHEGGDTDGFATVPPVMREIQGMLPFPALEWKDAVFARIVKQVGDRLYWEDWSTDIADIAGRYIALLDQLLEDPAHQDVFARFVEALRSTLNPSISPARALEMVAQHLLTKPLFDAMFTDQRFTELNPVSRAMQALVDAVGDSEVFVRERQPLDAFYESMVERIRAIDNVAGRQAIMVTLYDRFFSKAFPAMAEHLGIVFTPVEVVDYVLRSADHALRTHFGRSLADEGVTVIDPFAGTGTFITRLLSNGVIPPERMAAKYGREIFANEIVLLSYYIASVNIEAVYREVRADAGLDSGYEEFTGIVLTDTFQMHEGDGSLASEGEFSGNSERAERERGKAITAIVMNPPYSGKQRSANDDNQNLRYPRLDARIRDTYAALSTGMNKNSLYDSYFRALRWAADRIEGGGVIAFVSNNSFLDGNSADGVRLAFQEEFSDIYVLNLRGGINGRVGDRAKREGGNVFPIKTGVAITVLVKQPGGPEGGLARLHLTEVEDYLTREDKLDQLTREASIAGTEFREVVPNEHGDWLGQRDETFSTFMPLGDRETKGSEASTTVFRTFSGGLKTNRDPWCWGFSAERVAGNMRRMIETYNSFVEKGVTEASVLNDPTHISWNRALRKDFARQRLHVFHREAVRAGMYRPFTRAWAYVDRSMNDMVYRLPRIFPTGAHPNVALTVPTDYRKEWSVLMTNLLPDLNIMSACQYFPLWTWEPLPEADPSAPSLFDGLSTTSSVGGAFNGTFDFSRPLAEQVPEIIDGHRRRDAITDHALAAWRTHYGDETITSEDVFFHVYALLHHPDYRERYETDLKKSLPRIPFSPDFDEFVRVGRELAELHVNYERVEPHPAVHEQWSLNAPADEWERHRVTKLRWGKVGGKEERTRIVYNDHLTLTGIPAGVDEYKVGGRSPLEWVLDRYRVSEHKDSKIVNDPNDWFREVGDPRYLVDLIKRLVTVSLETQRLVGGLPPFMEEI